MSGPPGWILCSSTNEEARSKQGERNPVELHGALKVVPQQQDVDAGEPGKVAAALV